MPDPTAPPPEPSVPASQGVVLVVDDAPDTLRMLCNALAAEGYTVLVALDGADAVARFELAVPDAVLLDAVMPGLSGFEVCRRLKAVPGWAHVPVIFMTGLAETDHIVEGFASGGVDYVVKPLKIQEVLARLTTHMRNAQATRLARQAVDVGGLGVVLLDRHRRIAWHSPRAQRWLADGFVGAKAAGAWLATVATGAESRHPMPGGGQIVARPLGSVGLTETMLVLSMESGDAPSPARRSPTGTLTPRETEVLSWLAKGKTNRDIGEILGMSPRTVNKHLEHIFEKLGVETRAAAAAIASRVLIPASDDRALAQVAERGQ